MDFLFKINKHTCKTSVLIFLLCFWYQNLQAQTNLVSNPSFEQYINCPSGIKDDKPTIWYKPDRRGAGYRNACSVNGSTGVPYHYAPNGTGYQYAKTGLAYVFMFYMNSPMSNARNYFQVKLFDTLKRGKCYYAECNTNLSNSCKIACNNQSILFTNNPIYADTISPPREIILANPQITNFNNELIKDTLNWVKVSGVFIAQGGEQYLTLGNFKDDSHTNYVVVQPTGYYGASYYVDDVSVYALDSLPLKANAGLDTTIALGDSTFIGSLTNGIPNIKWYDTGGNIIDTGRPGFYVQPTTTTTYIIEQTVCGYYSRDTVTVTVNLLPLHWLGFEASPRPSPPAIRRDRQEREEEVLLRWQTANEVNVSHYNIQRSLPGKAFTNIAEVSANNKPYNEYQYFDTSALLSQSAKWFYRIQSIDKDGMRSYSAVKSVNLNKQLSTINIYPNPAKGSFNLDFPATEKGENTIRLLDAYGRQVLQKTITKRLNSIVLPTGAASGISLIEITNQQTGNKQVQKIVVKN